MRVYLFFRTYLFFIVTGLFINVISSCNRQNNPPSSALVISSFTPATAAKDDLITITGSGFSAASAGNIVTFNGKAAVVVSAGPGSLTVKVPSGVQDGKITIQVGSLTASSATDFTYQYTVTTLAGDGHSNFKEGTGTDAEFDLPYGVAVDAAGNVYVTDNDNNRIRKITPGGVTSTLAGSGVGSYKDGIVAEARFNTPLGIVLDPALNVYITDANNERIRKISQTGIVTTLAGNGTQGFKDTTDGPSAELYIPVGITRDAVGNLYVADASNHRIRKISPTGAVSTLAGDGVANYKEGTGTTAEFNCPTGIAIDALGNIYVTGSKENRIRKITPAGVTSTLAGDGHAGFKDGAGAAAEFNVPGGIAVDATGNVYVADVFNQRIRKITPSGIVTTLAGDGVASFKDGKGPLTEFSEPTSVAVDAAGKIYVADNSNNRIRILQ